MSNHIFDLYLIQSATERAKAYADDTVKRVQCRLVDDKDKSKRLSVGLCKWCWYRQATTLAGQAFTEYTCWRCDQTLSHANTAVPRLCDPCAKETQLCASCCGDINGKMRKEVP